MSLPRLKMTNAGSVLMAKGLTGETLAISRLALGDGILSGNPAEVTALVHEVVSVPLSEQLRTGGVVRVAGPLLLSEVEPFDWRELAVMAIDPDEGEIVYGYSYHASSGGRIDPTVAVGDQRLGVDVIVGDVEHVEVIIDSSLTWVTADALAAEKGAPGGLAGLDEDGILLPDQLPPLDFIPMSEKGAPNGVATLNAEGKVASALVDAYTRPETADTPTKALFGKPATALPTEIFEQLSAAALIRRTPPGTRYGGAMSSFADGQTIYLNEGGAAVPYILLKDDYEPGLNGNGRTAVLRQRAPVVGQWGSNNTMDNSAMFSWMNGPFFDRFGPTMQAAIGTTKFYGTPMGGVNTVQVIERSVFPLSLAEYGHTSSYARVEGSSIPAAVSNRIARSEANVAANHYTRTPAYTGAEVYGLDTNGAAIAMVSTSGLAYRPAFTLPENFEVYWYQDSVGNITPEGVTSNIVETVLGTKLGNIVHIEQFSYTGTGTFGQASAKTVITGFAPSLVIVAPAGGASSYTIGSRIWTRPQTRGTVYNDTVVALVTWLSNGVSWYHDTAAAYQLNVAGEPYIVTAIGFTTNEEG